MQSCHPDAGRIYLLTAINFEVVQLQEVADLSATMSALLAEVNGEKAESNSARLMRDKTYTLLKRAVDEIRSAGKYAYWQDKKRRKGYPSFHHR